MRERRNLCIKRHKVQLYQDTYLHVGGSGPVNANEGQVKYADQPFWRLGDRLLTGEKFEMPDSF